MTKRLPPHNPEFECQKCGGPCQRKYTHDADGNRVDGWYWVLLEQEFQQAVEAFRNAGNDGAAEVASRLVETTDDVPAELVQQQQDFWDRIRRFRGCSRCHMGDRRGHARPADGGDRAGHVRADNRDGVRHGVHPPRQRGAPRPAVDLAAAARNPLVRASAERKKLNR